MSVFASWTRRLNGELSTVTLASWQDTRHFVAGMNIMVAGVVVRVKAVRDDAGYLVVHRPLWWRVGRWVAARFGR